jgi:hypothetical protein
MEEELRRNIKNDAVPLERLAIMKYLFRPGFDQYISGIANRFELQVERECAGSGDIVEDKFHKYKSLAESFRA